MEDHLSLLKEYYYKYLDDPLEIMELEKYIYESEWLNSVIGEEKYLALISMDFKAKDIKWKLGDILLPLIGWADYEKIRIIGLLKNALKLDEKLPSILIEIYELYCDGYFFFEDLGLGYGLCCTCPSIDGKTYEDWNSLKPKQKERIMRVFKSRILPDIQRAIDWFEMGKIELLSERNEINQREYIDKRNDAEKTSNVWIIISEDKEKGSKVSRSNIEKF